MKKINLWVLAAILVCGASMFTSCSSNDDNPAQPDLNVAEKIIGKWMSAEINGKPFPTDNKGVYTFLTTTTARMSSSVNSRPELGDLWNDNSELDVNISGNVVTLTHQLDEHKTMTIEMAVTSINAKEMHADVHATLTVDGTVARTMNDHIRYERIEENYRQSILGMWEGRSTGAEGSEFDDGENHRWEYLTDGTFRYYHKVDGLWQLSDDVLHDYFVDGNLLCTRWKNAGEGQKENREWWEIESIKNGVMKWTALRQKDDGTTYTATFEMNKVPIPTKEEIQQYIIGKWITADYYNQPMVTNEKATMDIVSTTKAYVSASFNHNPAAGTAWFNMLETDVTIDGNKMTQTQQSDEHTKTVNEFTIADISASEFTAYLKFAIMVDGSVVHTKEYPVRYVKMAVDYSQVILGTWEGKVTSEDDEHTDGELHRWEYKADGTYTYYVKAGDQWVASSNTLNEYFVAGNLLCFRWVDNGVENREWWEITIENGVMKWKALRKREDGTTYTATFEMTKVQ